MKKTSIFGVIILSVSLFFNACNKNNPSTEPITETETQSEETSYPLDDVYHRLKNHPNIISIKGTDPAEIKDKYTQLYRIQYRQLVDHNDPSKGTFSQKVELGFRAYDRPNVLVTEGYSFSDNNTSYSSSYAPQNELAHLLDGNYIFVEHRYFGDSLVFEDFFNSQVDGWEYLTTEQAAGDLHCIVEDFKQVLTGKWLSSGASKGGMTTELYAYYYPHDIDVYVPRVAPFANKFQDERLYKFIFEEAGNVQYGLEKAKEYRDLVTDFMIKLLEYRDDFAERAYKETRSMFTNKMTKDTLYDLSVLEFAIGEWQYYQNFASLKKCLSMPDSDLTAKKNAFYKIYSSQAPFSDLEFGGIYQPYLLQSYRELGNYVHDTSYLVSAIEERGSSAKFVLGDLTYEDTYMTDELKAKYPRLELMGPKIEKFLKETDCIFILIYGSSDPWYAIRPEDPVDNSHVKIYVSQTLSHSAGVSNFDTDTRNEILNFIHEIID